MARERRWWWWRRRYGGSEGAGGAWGRGRRASWCEVAARPAVASAMMARADDMRAVGMAAAGLATAATVPASMVAARQRWQGRQWRRWRRCWRWRERRWRWWRRQGHVGWRRWAWRWWYGGGYDVAAYSRALLAVKRELRNGAELSGMRVIVRSFFTVLPRTGHLFFRAPPNKKDPAISSACGGENVQSVIKEAFSMTIGVTGQGTCDRDLVLNSSCQALEQRVRPAAHSALS